MSRSITRKVMIALVFAIFMTGFFWISANANPALAVSVTVQAEDDDGNFIIAPKQINVSAGYAETITSGDFYNDSPASSTDVTVLDALFAAHADYYGTDFNGDTYGDFIDGSASYITEMFEIEAGSGYGFPAIMFVVNGVQPNNGIEQEWPDWTGQNLEPTHGYMTYAMNQSVLSEGDVVNFFFINSYNDLYTFIMQQNGDNTVSFLGFNPTTKVFNSTETILLKGYDVFTDGYRVQSEWTINSLANANICRVSDGASVGTASGTGSVILSSLNLSTGTNYLTVKPGNGETHNYIPIYFKVYKAAS